MGIASEMKELTRNIASSHEDRVKRIGEIREEVKGAGAETHDMIHSFADSRMETSRQLRRDLARDKAEMIAEVKATRNGFQNSREEKSTQLRKDLAQDKAEMGAKVKAMRSGFQNSREEMSSALKKDLTEHNRGVRGEVAKMRQEIGASFQDMSAKLRKNLDRGAAARKSEAHVMRNGFQRSHKQMGAQLRKDLASYDRGIESEVSGMRQETMADMKEARTAWQGLASTRKAKIGGTKTKPKVAAPAAKEKNPDLETKMLATIGEYPAAGITLKEIASILRVAPVVLGKISTNLIKKGKIRRENKIYFPVVGK